jgi:xanthine dehydrogenase/oxidase
MPPNYTWQDLIAKAYGIGADLCSRYWIFPTTDTPCAYNVYGAAVSEALIDILTGETQIVRTDILYDCGQTMNGEIDIGKAQFYILYKILIYIH